ncbi:MAG: ADP-ribosylglycohydrolase family protein, partial [Microthrixaceae bacterium]
VYGAMLAALIQGQPVEEVLDADFWQFGELDPRVEAVARGSWIDKEPPAVRGTGYVVDALEAAIWAVAGATDVRDAVLRAANLGDDADTTAAIAGQLAGARWGESGIPAEWRQRVTEGERIAAIAGRLFDIGAGGAAPETWAHDESVHGYWLEPGVVLVGEYPGAVDDGKAARQINLLVDNGIRTFVDLTEVGERTAVGELRPYAEVMEPIATQRNLDLRRINHPIPDVDVLEVDEYDPILATVRGGTERGGVYVHCWGGVGRAGTVAGCLLVADGLSGDGALKRIAELRSGTRKANRTSPETPAQANVIRSR